MDNKDIDVVCIGSCMIDLNAYTSQLPRANETCFGHHFMQSFGGKGSNQIVQAARLGVRTLMIGSVGDDLYGSSYIDQFCKEGVIWKGIRSSTSPEFSTGIAHITIADNGSNCITIIQGANKLLSEANVISNSDSISKSKVLICQNEIPKEAIVAALKIAKANNVLSIFNPAPAQSMSELMDILLLSDIIVPNEIELSTLTGLAIDNDKLIEIAAKKLMESVNCKFVIVTLGEKGCCFVAEDMCVFINTDTVNAIDTVGAGDSFIGTLSACLSKMPLSTSSLMESITKALYCASQSVTRKGAQVSYCFRHELPEDFI